MQSPQEFEPSAVTRVAGASWQQSHRALIGKALIAGTHPSQTMSQRPMEAHAPIPELRAPAPQQSHRKAESGAVEPRQGAQSSCLSLFLALCLPHCLRLR